jgi:hypothetical protein
MGRTLQTTKKGKDDENDGGIKQERCFISTKLETPGLEPRTCILPSPPSGCDAHSSL